MSLCSHLAVARRALTLPAASHGVSRSRPLGARPPRPLPASTAAGGGVLLACGWILLSSSSPAFARTHESPADSVGGLGRVDSFAGWFHSAGNLLLHMSTFASFGRNGRDITNPSAEWPAGSDHEYIFAAALWVGGIVDRGGQPDTLVSAGFFGRFTDFHNFEPDEGCGNPVSGRCETFEGAPGGQRDFDDDGDGAVDEDQFDGQDNDGDGRVDEDFAAISQQMFHVVTYDTSTAENQFRTNDNDLHVPLGLRVDQQSYQWTEPLFDDFVGIEFKLTNISETLDGVGWDIDKAYVGFMVDADVGIDDPSLDPSTDDQVGFVEVNTTYQQGEETLPIHLTMGYMYDTLGEQGDDVPGYQGLLFLGHTVDTTTVESSEALAPREVRIHAFKTFARGGDPRDDRERYRFLRGLNDTIPTIDPSQTRGNDYRFLVSAGPFAKIPPGSTLTFQVAVVNGTIDEFTTETGNVVRIPDMSNPIQAQIVYNGAENADGEIVNWATGSPPPPPAQRVAPGDKHVTLEWDDAPESARDPLSRRQDFAGYQVWKAEGWRRDSNVPDDAMWRLIADFGAEDLSRVDTGGSGLGKYRFVDTRVQNGFWYWYAVTAYDDTGKFGKYTQTMKRTMPRTTAAQTNDDVYVVPNPYKEDAAWDLAETPGEPTGRRVKFFNLPSRATIRIFSVGGDHIATIEHDDASAEAAGQRAWNLISKNNQDTVSGIYVWHVSSPHGQDKVGKLVIIR